MVTVQFSFSVHVKDDVTFCVRLVCLTPTKHVCVIVYIVVAKRGVGHLVHDFPHRNLRCDHRRQRHSLHQVFDCLQIRRRQSVYPCRFKT